jgi:hypothetical protein
VKPVFAALPLTDNEFKVVKASSFGAAFVCSGIKVKSRESKTIRLI